VTTVLVDAALALLGLVRTQVPVAAPARTTTSTVTAHHRRFRTNDRTDPPAALRHLVPSNMTLSDVAADVMEAT
jgi:hypothetical protein